MMIFISFCRSLKLAIQAEQFWEAYTAANDTVVSRTFSGLFKNSVRCKECNFSSVSFEPFMYLAVPLPNASRMQLQVL